jgi:type I restriction enzyme S subunit
MTYLFKSKWFVSEMALRVRGIGSLEQGNVRTPRINPDDLGLIPVSLPTIEEQTTVADYLDTETARIDTLISKKQRMVSLMDEWFSASIGVLLQTSGEGDVPVKRLVSKIGSGSTPRGGSEVYVEKEEGIAFLRSQNVRKGLVDHADVVYITREADRELLRTRLQKGDVLLNITGGSIGRTAVVSEEDLPANVSQHVCILRPLLDVDPYLLQASLETTSVQDQIDLCQVGGNREGLNFDQVGSLRVKIPRGDSGIGTRERLDALRKRRDALGTALARQIELFQERRQTLITAAVTGQLEIPEVAA